MSVGCGSELSKKLDLGAEIRREELGRELTRIVVGATGIREDGTEFLPSDSEESLGQIAARLATEKREPHEPAIVGFEIRDNIMQIEMAVGDEAQTSTFGTSGNPTTYWIDATRVEDVPGKVALRNGKIINLLERDIFISSRPEEGSTNDQ